MIHVYEPVFTEHDAEVVASVVRSGIVSAFGPFVSELEERFARYAGRRYGLACSSGTAGLFLALSSLVKWGEKVIVPTCSFVATAFAVRHAGANPIFVDSNERDWNLDLNKVEDICNNNRIKAVLVVHNYGMPTNMRALEQLSDKHGFIIVEDACEAIGSAIASRPAGSFGRASVFSFYGNKIIAAGEGGLIATDDPELYGQMKLMRGQGQAPNKRFWHIVDGWNFRMTNLQAALICSQFNRIQTILDRKMDIYRIYRRNLDRQLTWQVGSDKAVSNWWMISVRHQQPGWYEKAQRHLAENDIETRPIFPAIHKMPPFRPDSTQAPVADMLHDQGISLPSGPGSSDDDIKYVCEKVNKIV